MASAIGELQALVDRLSKTVGEQHDALQTADPALLIHCRRALLEVLDTLSLAQARQSPAVPAVAWNSLTAIEATRRLIWLRGCPLKASEIITELTCRGWRSRPTKTPGATLCADLEQAHQHVCLVDGNRWALTPAAEQLERAKAILEADRPFPEVESDVVLKQGFMPSKVRRR